MTPFQAAHTAKVKLDDREYLVSYLIHGEVPVVESPARSYVTRLEISNVFADGVKLPTYPGFLARIVERLWELPVDDYLYEAYLKAADDALPSSDA